MHEAPAITTSLWYYILTVLISAVVALIIHWLLIRHVYRTLLNLDKSRIEHEKRQKAQIVAELLALWIRGGSFGSEEKRKLNELSFQCSLWLPANILIDLSNRLTNAAQAKDIKEILADVRVHLGNDKIDPGIIINW